MNNDNDLINKPSIDELERVQISEGLGIIMNRAFVTAYAKGWHEKPKTFVEDLALIHSELSEALEEYRDGHTTNEAYTTPEGKPLGVPSELADVIIRVAELAQRHDIDLADAIITKLEFNASRPYRHGGKVI